MEVVARRDAPLSGSTDTDGSRKNTQLECLYNRLVEVLENSYLGSGEHDLGRGLTGRTSSSGAADRYDF